MKEEAIQYYISDIAARLEGLMEHDRMMRDDRCSQFRDELERWRERDIDLIKRRYEKLKYWMEQ